MRALGETQRYPVALASGIAIPGIIGVGISAFNNGDLKTLAVTGFWSVGTAALAMSDPRVRERIRNYVGASAKTPGVDQKGVVFDPSQKNNPDV